ncbi:MAG TPA: family 16 glycosylhydrolase [Bryobacteraceae bacterium]|nr:family 16 glycosylhydrolase [Bryobacteraceae bacterium]
MPVTNRPIRVFVHLAHGFGASQWEAKWKRGEIIGINDHLPYGYFWAREEGCLIEYSEDGKEGLAAKLLRMGIRALLGFDFVHAWRNRRGITGAEVVWTHTESQHLAVLLLLRGRLQAERPKVVAQSVWLFDRWNRLSRPRRWFYRGLMRQADILTVLSPENLQRARELFPMCRSEIILFGIRAEEIRERRQHAVRSPIRVLSLGNDRDRDWETLVDAVKGWDRCTLRVISPGISRALVRGAPNVEIVHPQTNKELLSLYDWADFIALALKPNLHASGITVIEEATVCGVPVICTDTGGLRAYFSDAEVRYVPPNEPAALQRAIELLAEEDDGGASMLERARHRMRAAGLSSRDFARRHVELSRELLGSAAIASAGPTVNQRRSQPPRLPLPPAQRAASVLCVAAGTLISGLLFGFAGAFGATRTDGAAIDLCAFVPTFSEDFDKLSVSSWGDGGTRWIAHTPWHGDFGDAAFADPGPGFPFQVKDGVLEIEARKDLEGKWQSGLLASATPSTEGFSQRYGYFEARALLPPGPGVWPGFWLNSSQPQASKKPGVEVDVLEYYGQFPNAYHSAVHVWDKADPTKNRVQDHVTDVPSGSLSSAFHTYGADIEPDRITFYLDRHETWRVATPPELQGPLMLLVNLALGSGWPIDRTPNPSIMKVDYVHAYRPRTQQEAAASCHDSSEGTARPPNRP